MSFWKKFKTGLKIANVGAKVAINFLPAGKAAKIVEVIAQGSDLGNQVITSVERGEK